MSYPVAPIVMGLFFVFATAMTALVALTMLTPGGPLDAIWSFKPAAHAQLAAFTPASGAAFAALSFVMAAASVGCFQRRRWGWTLALVLVAANGVGDLARAATGELAEGLFGAAVVAALLYWLSRPATRASFCN